MISFTYGFFKKLSSYKILVIATYTFKIFKINQLQKIF